MIEEKLDKIISQNELMIELLKRIADKPPVVFNYPSYQPVPLPNYQRIEITCDLGKTGIDLNDEVNRHRIHQDSVIY